MCCKSTSEGCTAYSQRRSWQKHIGEGGDHTQRGMATFQEQRMQWSEEAGWVEVGRRRSSSCSMGFHVPIIKKGRSTNKHNQPHIGLEEDAKFVQGRDDQGLEAHSSALLDRPCKRTPQPTVCDLLQEGRNKNVVHIKGRAKEEYQRTELRWSVDS